MKIKTLLVESDPDIRKELRSKLAFYPSVEIVEEVNTAEAAFVFLQSTPVDLVISNIQPAPAETTSDGTALASVIADRFPDIQILLYLPDAKDLARVSNCGCQLFLMLPLDHYALQRAIHRVQYICELQQYKQYAGNRSIMVKTKEGYERIALNDILFLERINRRNAIVTQDGRMIYLFRYTMEELETLFSGCGFYRCYQSFIVNMSKVAGIRVDNEKKIYSILFKDYSGEIMLSRDKYSEFVSLLKRQYANVSI